MRICPVVFTFGAARSLPFLYLCLSFSYEIIYPQEGRRFCDLSDAAID
jgi:hypothetical protein